VKHVLKTFDNLVSLSANIIVLKMIYCFAATDSPNNGLQQVHARIFRCPSPTQPCLWHQFRYWRGL